MPTWTITNGHLDEVPDTVITHDTHLHDVVTNTITIHGPATVEAHADINGTIHLAAGATLHAWATVNGTITIDEHATLATHGPVNGHIHHMADGTDDQP